MTETTLEITQQQQQINIMDILPTIQQAKEKQDRKKYYSMYNNRPEIKEKRRLKRLEKEQRQDKETNEQNAKYYSAESIRVLMSFKEWTELNQEKRKLWLDFNWTMKDCREAPSIAGIMKLEQVAGKLIRDFWKTARAEERKGKNWNSISEEKQNRLIKYWGNEKARIENGYIDELERLEKQGESYLKEIEMSKYHEERGKIKCECWQCEEKKTIQVEVKERLKKDMENYDERTGATDKEECPQCGKLKILDEESGVCKNCSDNL